MFIFPCMPNQIAPESDYMNELDRSPEWIAEIKKNGWRCVIEKEGDRLTLWTRKHTLITMPVPEIRQTLGGLPDCLLDGELLNYKRIKDGENSLYLFDVILWKGEPIHERPFASRRQILEGIYKEYLSTSPDIELSQIVHIGKKRLYYQSIEGENEGIVLKKLSGKYPIGQKSMDNPHWIKVKRVESHVKDGGQLWV